MTTKNLKMTRARRQELERKKAMRRFAIGAALVGLLAIGAAGTFVYKFNTSDATIAQGNQAFASQQYDAALEKYTSAQTSAPIFAEPFYNAANVFYKQGAFDKAQAMLEQALTRSNEKIAQFLEYNLGNVAYNAKQFEQAIAAYEDALRLNPDDADAKHNLELALLQKQQQDQQQQNQQQNQEQQNQNQQDQQQQNQDQQQQQNQNSQDQQNQQQQNQEQNGQQGQDQQQQQQDAQQQNGQPQDQQNQQQNGQPQDAQNQNGQPQNGQQQQDAAPGEQTDEQGNEQGYAYKEGELTEQQAEQLLAAVGGNSQTLLEKLQQYLYVPAGEPEKDW